MTIDLLVLIRILGLTIACGIGIFRLYKNYLTQREKYIYSLAVLTTAWFSVGYLVSCFREFFGVSSEFIHTYLRMGWPPLIVLLILFMLYYRRVPNLRR